VPGGVLTINVPAGNGNPARTIRFGRYQLASLGNTQNANPTTPPGIGTFVHENGHMIMRWPDLYPYVNGQRNFVAGYCVMSSSNGNNPQMPNPHFRNMAGWITVTDITSTNATLTHTANSNTAFRYVRNDAESYFIEARRQTGRSQNIPGQGLLIWHVHTGGDNANYEVGHSSAARRIPLMAVMQANNGTVNPGANSPYVASRNTQFNRNSTPAARYHSFGTASNTSPWSGEYSDINITEISAINTSANNMTFKIGTGNDLQRLLTASMLSIPAVTFNGTARTPVLTVRDGTTTLVMGTHYNAALTPQTNAGIYKVTVTGIGSYTGTADINFVINRKSLTETTMAIPAVTFNNTAHTPVLTVTDGSRTLVRNTDYTVDLRQRTNAGTYSVTVTGRGNYSGAALVNFVVNPRPLTGATVAVSGTYTYTGAAQTPAASNVTVTLTGYTPTYSIAATNNTNAGTATLTVTGTGNFSGTAARTFQIQRKPLTAAMLSISPATFNNTAQTPVLTVIDGSRTLTAPADYTVTLTPQTNAGTYPVTVTGAGNYTGTSSVNFVIGPKTLTAEMLDIPSVTFNGTEHTPILTVIDDTETLEADTDYTAVLTSQTNAGAYPVAVTGTGNYAGTAHVDFVIDPKALTTGMLDIPSVTFNGTVHTPVLTVIDEGEMLVADTDYTVILTPQTNAGTYYVTVTGTGNYGGTPSVNFVINPKILTAEMLSVPTVTFNGAAQTPVLTVTDGTETLVLNIDYTVTLTPRTNVGTYPITVTGTGNYTGTPSVNFVIDNATSVLPQDRFKPDFQFNEELSVSVLISEFTAGPNPVVRSSGSGLVSFFRQGKSIQNGTLTIYDASGNVINKIRINDNANQRADRHPPLRTPNSTAGGDGDRPAARRIVGSWDLRDAKGRPVSEGTYLVKGVITDVNGKKERISMIIGVR
jgi:formaldehyde-activating enzyme involved in methanogenesis